MLSLGLVQDGLGQMMPPIPPAREGARPPAKEVDRTKTDLWNLSFKLREHEGLEKIELAAAVEAGYALISVANHLSIYLHLLDVAEIGENNGVEYGKFDGPLRKAAYEIARAAHYQSDKCDYWIKVVELESLREEILAGQEAMNEIAALLTHYFNGTDPAPAEGQDGEQPGNSPASKPEVQPR